jgi:hypothetical protein
MWFRHRVDCFRQFCVPSIRAQTARTRFSYIILVDVATSAAMAREILDAVAGLDARLLYVTADTYVRKLQEHVRSSSADLVITSRVDNDDALHRRYIEAVVDAVAEVQVPAVVDPVDGLRYDLQQNLGYIAPKTTWFTPFCSYVEERVRAVTVFSASNTFHPPGWPCIRLSGYRWCQIVHGRNLANRVLPHHTRYEIPWDEFGVTLGKGSD